MPLIYHRNNSTAATHVYLGFLLEVGQVGKIYRMPIGGASTPELIKQVSPNNDLYDIACHDPDGVVVYAMESGTDQIRKVNYDGTGDALVVSSPTPDVRMLDVTPGGVVWYTCYNEIRKVNIDGSGDMSVYTGHNTLKGIGTLNGAAEIRVAQDNFRRIQKGPMTPGSLSVITTDSEYIVPILVVEEENIIFYTSFGGPIKRCDLNGGSPATWRNATCYDMAWESSTKRVFWIEEGSGLGGVWSANIDGSDARLIRNLIGDGLPVPKRISLARIE